MLPSSFLKSKSFTPLPFQKETWAAYRAGKSGLIHAPTGQGKTMAIYLAPLIDSLNSEGCSILWITPLRALAADTLRALREAQQFYNPNLTAEARTGDTPASLRAKLRKQLPHTLVTTPESLSLMLTHEDTREKLQNLQCIIIDEWHELLGTKRGTQTELCLARLRNWLPSLQTWALSATLGNLTEAAQALQGGAASGCPTTPAQNPTTTKKTQPKIRENSRPFAVKNPIIISAKTNKPILIETIIPKEIDTFPWHGHIGTSLASQVIQRIESANSTLLFTNTRSQTEIWFQEILSLRPNWKNLIALHHGSLDRTERDLAESGLRDGSLKCVVATSSLDLGVDFSPVDQVIQIGSPKGIARLLQRAGRSGHQPNTPSKIIGVPTNALELIEFAAARQAASDNSIESRPPLSKPIDVLVQHLVTCAISQPFLPHEMLAEVRSTHAYQNLTYAEWHWALTHITIGGNALAAYPQYHKATITPTGHYTVTDKKLITRHRLSIGTITSDPHVTLKFLNGQILGTVEETFISKLKPGSSFIFSGRHLSLIRFQQKTATVKISSKPSKGNIAIWNGTKMPLSSELAIAFSDIINKEGRNPSAHQPEPNPKSPQPTSSLASIHAHSRLKNPQPQPTDLSAIASATADHCSLITRHSSPELLAVAPILSIQKSWSRIPDSDSLLIEHTTSREGQHLFFYPFAGRLVHEGLAALLAFRISRTNPITITATQNDYAFSLTAKRGLPFLEKSLRSLLSPDNLLQDLLDCINSAELARRQFREIARVSGLILQQIPGRSSPSDRQLQSSASLLFEVLQRYDPSNLLLTQAHNEILERQLELTRLKASLEKIQTLPFTLIETKKLSPFAFPLWADRLQATHITADATTRLEAMLQELNKASSNP